MIFVIILTTADHYKPSLILNNLAHLHVIYVR